MQLHINIDHAATLRQARGTVYPDPVAVAELAEAAGADGITAHLREDRRHIQDDDIVRLRKAVRGTFNMEMAATAEMVAIARRIRPDIVTLVPEKRAERTTEGGLNLENDRGAIKSAIATLAADQIAVSLFVDPTEAALRAAKELECDHVELHTGDYCELAAKGAATDEEIKRLAIAARLGKSLGLHVAAGHGLSTENVGKVAAIGEIVELNIGHAVIARAVFVGISAAVRELKHAIAQSPRQ